MLPLPDAVGRWMRRARWLRWLDALVGWLLFWGLAALAWPGASAQAQGLLAGLALPALAGLRRVRAVWRPLSGPVALVVSQPLRPGARAWFVTTRRAERVIVTSRRGWRVVIANLGEGPAEGITVRRSRVFLVPADEPHRADGAP